MKPPAPPPALAAAEEISTLIELYHKTDERLDELLGGEIDSVTASNGRTIVLRRAQREMRDAESARQGAILAVLPAHIALLDRRGTIISVNDAWRRFADANGLSGPRYMLGVNYLAVCAQGRGNGSTEALGVAEGIRTVLSGHAESFSMEYSCPSPTQERWFQLTVTPLPGEPPNGAVIMHLDVTERKQAADALDQLSRQTEKRERMLNTMLSSISDYAYTYDRQGRFLFANQPLLDLWGRKLEDIVGKNFLDLAYPPELAAKFQGQVAEVFATGKVVSDETRYTGAAGQEGWYEYIFSPAFAADGTVDFVAGTARVTTGRKQAENALRASEAEFRTLASAIPQIAWVKKPDGYTDYFNRQWMDYSGLTLQESLGHEFHNHFHPEDQPAAWAAWEHARRTCSAYSVECRLRRADGVYRWWLIRGVPLLDGAGAVTKWIGTCTDIEDLKGAEIEISRANRELQRQQTELRVLFDLMPAMIWFKDTENNILRVNQRVADMIGREVEDIEGKSSLEIYPGLAEELYREDLEVIRSGVPTLGIVQAVKDTQGNTIWIERNKVPYRDETGKVIGIVSMAQDVTERKRDQDALRELNTELEVRVRARTAELDMARDEAEKANRAKSAFLAAMSHEIRTPMNGVIGMIEVLHQTSMQGYQVEMIDLIRDSAFSLLQIIEDILDFSKIEAGKLELIEEPMDIAATVEKVCGMLDHLAVKGNVRLTMFIDPAIPRFILGDENRLRQVLINLTGNAIKFSAGRDTPGHVAVRVVMVERNGDAIKLDLIVRDDGIGIEEATLARLFTPFAQADVSTTRRFGGSGLGLVISKMLAQLMHGVISVQSVLGAGSTFKVRLPFTAVAAAEGPIDPLELAKGLRCRIIGAELPLADDLDAYLARAGVIVERAPDLAAAASAGYVPGMTLWLILPSQTVPQLDQLRAMAPRVLDAETRFIVLEWGKRRRPRVIAPDLVLVDADSLFRRTLFRMLALAAGRLKGEFSNDETTVEPPAPSRRAALQQHRLILVAEDNETNRIVVLRQLAVLGFAAEVAVNGLDALERWRSGLFALLLTDLHMPQMDGYALARAIRSEEAPDHHMPIIAFTANALRDEELRCLAAGMDAYLSKPVRLAQLKASIEKWLVPASEASAHETSPQPPIAVTPPADLAVLVALVGDDPAVINEVLQTFRDSAVQSRVEMSEGIKSESLQAVADAAHRLKSAARSIGALRVGEICNELERAAKEPTTAELKALLPLFESELAAVLRFLDSR